MSGRVLTVKAIPKAARNEVIGPLPDGTYKVKVTAAPEKGKANAAICELLAKHFGIPKSHVAVIRGESSSSKQIALQEPASD